jgi:hypothetical protein
MSAGAAHAQTAEPKQVVAAQPGVDVPAVQARRKTLFAQMLMRPDDLDTAFEYAALSVQVGDLEAAISTLERMLIFAPGLPRLQLELGVLYYRLAAYETARSYFDAAISGPDVPQEVRDKVAQYTTGIDRAGETSRFAGQVRAGVRYQTNANRSPSGAILLNGLPFTLDPDAAGTGDGNVYGLGVFQASLELPGQGDTLEANLILYGSKQFERDELDVALAEVTVGPSFSLGRFGIENAAVGIYGIGSGLYVDGEFYSAAVGAGTRLLMQPAPGMSWTTAFEYRHRDYRVSSIAPTADNRDGDEFRLFTAVSKIFTPTMAVAANAYVQHTDAQAGFLTYTETGFSLSPSFAFQPPIGEGAEAWIFSPNAGLVYRSYQDPDPMINAARAERDLELFVGADLTVPLVDRWALLAETEYRHFNSNYDTKTFDNFSVSLSVVKGF